VLDVLRYFPSAKVQGHAELNALVASLEPLRPRLYSISSSLKAHPDQVHLTVAAVRYSLDGCERIRKGVASLSDRAYAARPQSGIFIQESHRSPAD
jgi:sulfite reductase (NADPH) flavoprotein alpha-component